MLLRTWSPMKETKREQENFFRSLRDVGISAVIVSDPALIEICATEAPGLPIHLSTQASATNFETLEFWKEEGLGTCRLGTRSFNGRSRRDP